jgi:multiple sugar transport system substrate-binding protein
MSNKLLERRFSNRARIRAIPAAAAALVAPAILRRSVSAQDKTTVRVTGWTSSDAEQKNFQQILDDFSSQNPDIDLKYEPIPSDYPTKMQTDMAAGTVADVFYVDSSVAPDWMASGQLRELDADMQASGVSTDDFYPGLIQAFQLDGKTYGLPKDFSTLAMVYDKKAFTDAGIANPPANWDEIKTVAKTLKDSTGQPPIVIPADIAREFAFLYAAGGSLFSADGSQITLDTPESQAALDFYYGLYKDGLAATPADAGAEWPGDALAKGLASIVFEGNWVFPFLKENAPDLQFGIAEMPEGPKGKATLAFTVSFSEFVDTKVPDQAWKLTNYLTGPDGMAKWVSLGLAMPTRKALSDAWIKQFPERQPFLAGGDYAHGWQLGVGGNAFINDANAELQGLFAGQQDVATTLQKMQKAAEARIQVGATVGSVALPTAVASPAP